jgi:uncharacterized protein
VNDDFDRSIVEDIAHRPWPMPSRPWVMTQTWSDLLFAHWPVDASLVRPAVPAALQLDLFDGQAWLAVVPFRMSNVASRGTAFARRTFLEVNVRTYVTAGGKPGVFFFSLDASSRLAVWGARTFLNMPYHLASMTLDAHGADVTFCSKRRHSGERFIAGYRPLGDAGAARPGTQEHFFAERYCLYHVDRGGRPYRLEIHHRPWPLQAAHAEIEANELLDTTVVGPAKAPAHVLFARRLDVFAWSPQAL